MARILVVDDDSAIRETLRLLLEDAGYDVAEASDGRIALDILRSSMRPMVVLLDLMMPRMNGAQVLAAVAADIRLAAMHTFIAVTASPMARSFALGQLGSPMAVPCIEKPFDIDDVVAAVERAAERQERTLPAHAAEASDPLDALAVGG